MGSSAVEDAERREMIDAVQTTAAALDKVGDAHHELATGIPGIRDDIKELGGKVDALAVELRAQNTLEERRLRLEERQQASAERKEETTDHGIRLEKQAEADTAKIKAEADADAARVKAAADVELARLRAQAEFETAKRSTDFQVLIVEKASSAFSAAFTSKPAMLFWGMVTTVGAQLAFGKGPAVDFARMIFPQLLGGQ